MTERTPHDPAKDLAPYLASYEVLELGKILDGRAAAAAADPPPPERKGYERRSYGTPEQTVNALEHLKQTMGTAPASLAPSALPERLIMERPAEPSRRAQQIETITNSLAEPIAEAIALNSPQGADIADVMADVRQNIYEHLSSLPGDKVTQLVVPHEPKAPKVDMIGTYQLNEPKQQINPRDGQTYEVPRGEYPVMGLLSNDRKSIVATAIILVAPNRQGDLMDIVVPVRPVDVPAMVQRREIVMETKALARDAYESQLKPTVKFPLSMFTGGEEQKKAQAQSRAPEAPEQRMRIARSA